MDNTEKKPLDEAKLAWEQEGKHGDRAARIARNVKWARYYRYLAESRFDSGEVGFDPHAEEVVLYLLSNGWLDENSSVLDVGAGTGTFALSLARHCASVTALEMDDASLSVLDQSTNLLGFSNIICVSGMWETYEAKKRFSLAFSSMCPAICDYNELLRLEAMAEHACCLIAVTLGSYDMHRKNLMQLLGVKPEGGMTTDALRYYEVLYLMERQPDVRNWSGHYESHYSVREACERNAVYFEIFGLQKETTLPVLRSYFEGRMDDDGIVHDETQLNTALICWRPKR